MKFGSTVTSIWRVMARYMQADFRENTRKNSRNNRVSSYRKILAAPNPAPAPPAWMVKMNGTFIIVV